LNKLVGHNIVELNTNHIPRGLVPLERLFDINDVSRKVSMKNQEHEVVECNIGTTANPKVVKISKALPEEQRSRYVSLMKQCSDILHGLMRTSRPLILTLFNTRSP
jgi:hypothetical protein